MSESVSKLEIDSKPVYVKYAEKDNAGNTIKDTYTNVKLSSLHQSAVNFVYDSSTHTLSITTTE